MRLLLRPEGTAPRRGFEPGLRAVLVLCLLVFAGCRSTSPSGSRVTATITVEGTTEAKMLSTASEVFRAHGFQVSPSPGYSLVFEKEAGSVSNFMYGGWMSPGVWLRARVRVVNIGSGRLAMDCTAYYVRNRGEIGVEEEQAGPSSGQFKEILKEIEAKLALTAQPPNF